MKPLQIEMTEVVSEEGFRSWKVTYFVGALDVDVKVFSELKTALESIRLFYVKAGRTDHPGPIVPKEWINQ